MKKYFHIFIGIVVLLLIVIILLRSSSSISGDPIKVGVITDLSSTAAGVYGIPLKQGIELAMSEIDPSGDKFEVIFEDYKLESKLALPAYSSLKLRGVRIFIVDGSSGISILAPEAKRDGNIILNPSSFIPTYKDGNPLTCRIAMTTDTYAPAYADFIINKLKKKNVALLLPNVEAGVALRDSISNEVLKAGGDIVFSELYLKDTTDFRAEITKLKAVKDVEVIIALNYYKSVSSMFQQFNDLSLNKQVITDDWTVSNSALVDLSLVNGAYFVGYPYSGDNPKTDLEKQFFDKYNKKYGATPKLEGLMGYDLLSLINLAVSKKGSSEPESISSYLTSEIRDYNGASGNLSFNSDCEVERNAIFRKVDGMKFIEVQ